MATATVQTIVFEAPPTPDAPAPTREDIRAALVARPGEWAIVFRADRLARCEDHAARIVSGDTYGPGFEAVARSSGSRADARVYARKIA